MKRFIFLYLLYTFQLAYANGNPLDNFLNGLETIESNFSQTLVNESGQMIENSSGTLYLRQPAQFHWAYEVPYTQHIISDGQSLWIYDEDLEQVTIRNITEDLSQTPAGIILGDNNITEHFIELELGNIDGFDWVELTPKDIESQYSSIKIGFDNNKLGMLLIHDSLGQITRIDFIDVKRNIKIDENRFVFTGVEGIDVIDERNKE